MKKSFKKIMVGFMVLCMSIVFTASYSSAGIFIDFDDIDSVSYFSPGYLLAQNALAEEYSDLGVHFSGLGDVLNITDGGWEPYVLLEEPFSSPNALAFNSWADVPLPETITFDFTASSVSFDFSGISSTGTLILEGYLDGTFVDSVNIAIVEGAWTNLTLSGGSYDQVVITNDNNGADYGFVIDNLTINPVPVPGALLLLGSGLLGLIGIRRRK